MCIICKSILWLQQEIVDEYDQRGIPLDVLVTDMDWHITFYKEAALGKKDQVHGCICEHSGSPEPQVNS